MRTFTDVINRWPSLSEFAADIGVKYGTAQVMRWRGTIPSDYWKRTSEAAAKRGIDGITVEFLASLKKSIRRSEKGRAA